MTSRLAVLLTCLAATAAAIDHPEQARKLAIRDASGRQSVVWTATQPPPAAPATSPLAVGGTLSVETAGGETAAYLLPASGWTVDTTGTTYKFRNPLAPGGPSAVKSATLKVGKALKLTTKASGVTLDEPTQGTIHVALTIGGDVYCSTCTAPSRDQPGRYTARACPAPASCAGLFTTTTTTTTSTSTTFVPGICGNGVVDQPSEQCDLPDPGICDDVPHPWISCGAPGFPTACSCCFVGGCELSALGSTPCCDGATCQDVTGAGAARTGVCIPPTCTQDADCNGYSCVGGTCCGGAGDFCGVAGCCPGNGTACSPVPFAGTPVCCRPPGASCGAFDECCSGTCTGGVCG